MRTDIGKLYIKLAIRLTAIGAFLLILTPCDCRKSIPAPAKIIVTVDPGCQVDVVRNHVDTVIKIKGSLPNQMLGVIYSVLYPKEYRYVFKVDDSFDFETKYQIPDTEELIPMTFLTFGNRHLVCKLKFTHSDGSPLTSGELDGESRTNQIKSEDKF